MEPQESLKSQSNLEKEKQGWKYHIPRFQAIRQNYSNQNSMVLAQKQTRRMIEQKRAQKETHTYKINL